MLTLWHEEGREFDPRPGQYSRMSCSSDQVTGTVFPHLNMPFLPNSKYNYLEHCPRGEALIISHLRFSSNEVANDVKQLPFRPLLLLRKVYSLGPWRRDMVFMVIIMLGLGIFPKGFFRGHFSRWLRS